MRRSSLFLVLTTLALLSLSVALASPIEAIAPSAQQKVLNLYVNANTGDDKNACVTLDRPCRSLQAAFDRIPAILSQEVLVSVAEGTYTGEAALKDRLSPHGYAVHVVGQKGITFLDGLDQLGTGITVYRAPRVFLEGLSVKGFLRAGLSFANTAPIEVSSTRIFSNRGVGLEIEESDILVLESIVDENGGHGIVCNEGLVEFRAQEGGKGVVISRNGGNGVRAIGCHAIFEGPAMIALNQSGLVAEHGAEINLMNRTDVIVTGNTTASSGGALPPPEDPGIKPAPLMAVPVVNLPLCELRADNHGLVTGYRNASVQGTCLCLDSHFGVCNPD